MRQASSELNRKPEDLDLTGVDSMEAKKRLPDLGSRKVGSCQLFN